MNTINPVQHMNLNRFCCLASYLIMTPSCIWRNGTDPMSYRIQEIQDLPPSCPSLIKKLTTSLCFLSATLLAAIESIVYIALLAITYLVLAGKTQCQFYGKLNDKLGSSIFTLIWSISSQVFNYTSNYLYALEPVARFNLEEKLQVRGFVRQFDYEAVAYLNAAIDHVTSNGLAYPSDAQESTSSLQDLKLTKSILHAAKKLQIIYNNHPCESFRIKFQEYDPFIYSLTPILLALDYLLNEENLTPTSSKLLVFSPEQIELINEIKQSKAWQIVKDLPIIKEIQSADPSSDKTIFDIMAAFLANKTIEKEYKDCIDKLRGICVTKSHLASAMRKVKTD